MLSFHYKGRIHKGKFAMRSLRYAFSDQAARLFPALQRRWLLPVESRPIAEAASRDLSFPSVAVDKKAPPELVKLDTVRPGPLQTVHHVYALENVTLTGWAGGMIQDGLLLAVSEPQNWVSTLRAHPHAERQLTSGRIHYNLMSPMPARGHIFHWLCDSLIPLISFLESGRLAERLVPIVNRKPSEIQRRSFAYLAARYGLADIEPLGQYEAAHVPKLRTSIAVPDFPRALQTQAGLARIDDLGAFLATEAAAEPMPRRVYVSRDDARLRRVVNEDEILPRLEAEGFRRVILKGMPISRQVQLFRGAEAVVAPHGAGLAHTIWCAPGTKVLEFFPDPDGPRGHPRNATCNFWLVAELRGLKHSASFGSPPLNRNDGFRLEISTLAAALEKAGIL